MMTDMTTRSHRWLSFGTVGMMAMMMTASVAMMALFVPASTASAQGRDWTRPRPSDNSPAAPKKVLRLRSTGGDLSAVVADALAAHPKLLERFHVVRVNADGDKEDADAVITVSAAVVPAEAMGVVNRRILVVLNLVDPASGEVLEGQRHAFADLGSAFNELGDVSSRFASLVAAPEPPSSAVPSWVTNPQPVSGFFVAVGDATTRMERSAQMASGANARRNLAQQIYEVARETMIQTMRGPRGSRVSPTIPDTIDLALDGAEISRRATIPAARGEVTVFSEARLSVENARDAFFIAARQMAQSHMPPLRLDEAELWRAVIAKMGGSAPAPVPAPTADVEVLRRTVLDGGYVELVLATRADTVSAAAERTRRWACLHGLGDDLARHANTLQNAADLSTAVTQNTSLDLTVVRPEGNQLYVEARIRVNGNAFRQWAQRHLRPGGDSGPGR